jgi:PAS domain S-box-containing protein
MGLPFYQGSTLHGMVGVANRPGGYDDALIGFLQPFLATCSNLIAAITTEQQRRMAEEKLHVSEERYRTVVEDMPAMICRFLPDGTLTFVNSMYCQYFGRQKEELIGYNFFQFIPAEDQGKVKDHFMSLCQEKPMITYEHQVFAPDGSVLWQEWTDRALFNATGNIIEYQSIGRDISDRRQTEEALRLNESRLNSLLELSQKAYQLSEKEIVQFGLEEAVRLTESKIGYFHFVQCC